MQTSDVPSSPAAAPAKWWHELTGYHWFVFVVAALGWLADCMDQQLFVLARGHAVSELLSTPERKKEIEDAAQTGDADREAELRAALDKDITDKATLSTAFFLIGWAVGGLAFGVLGDKWGRVKTMLLTILIYSVFTGLSALSLGVTDFILYRFLTGLGVGGEFAVGVSLLAEVMPDRARPHALGLLQAFSAIGNCTAAGLFILLGYLVQSDSYHVEAFGKPVAAWRLMFLFGLAPAVLALLVRRRLREPERWKHAVATGGVKQAGSYGELFGDPRWRKHAIVGLCLAFSGVVGLWGIGFFSADLVSAIFNETFQKEGLSGDVLKGQKMIWAGVNQLMLNIGAFFGIYAFSRITHFTGRRIAFVVSFLLAMLSTASVYWFLDRRSDIFWMIPIMGFCQLAVFGGYAIYFPELFPTRLRSTGTSFCYNVGRMVAAVGPLMLAQLKDDMKVYATKADPNLPFRLAGVVLSSVFLLGVIAVWFAPETKDRPLPE